VVADPLCGLAVAGPLLPVLLVELFPAVAGPVAPVLPDWVMPVVLASPDLALEDEFDVVFTAPDWPPLPESPEVATGWRWHFRCRSTRSNRCSPRWPFASGGSGD